MKTKAIARLQKVANKEVSSFVLAKARILAKEDAASEGFIKKLTNARSSVEDLVDFSSDASVSAWLRQLDKDDGTKMGPAYTKLAKAAQDMKKALEAFEDSLAAK